MTLFLSLQGHQSSKVRSNILRNRVCDFLLVFYRVFYNWPLMLQFYITLPQCVYWFLEQPTPCWPTASLSDVSQH